MIGNYIRLENEKIYLHKSFMKMLDDIECLVFDCDGVLINTNNSYRKTIKQTLSFIFKPFPQRKLIGYKEIEKLKFTGIYNNDWDSTYALALFLFTTLSKEQAKKVLKWPTIWRLKAVDFKSSKNGFKLKFESFLESLKMDPISDPEKYSTKICREKGTFDELKEFINIIGRPTNVQQSLLAKVFDSIYYGKKLFKKIYAIEPPIKILKGNIERERLHVSKRTLSFLKDIFNSKMYLLTGRSRVSIQYKMKDIEEYFDVKKSFFIEDMVREGFGNVNLVKKPSPAPLLNLADDQTTLYVGDSAEDLILAKKAKEVSNRIYFAGVAKPNDKTLTYFMESNTDLIISSVNMLPKVFKNSIR